MAHSKEPSTLACSFCGKSVREVRKLISGPTVYICDECVGLCDDIISKADETVPEIAAFRAMSLLEFLKLHCNGRAVDSITIGDLRSAIQTEWNQRLPKPPVAPQPTPPPSDPESAGTIKERELTAFLSKQYSVPAMDLESFEIDPEITQLIPEEVQRKHVLVPVNRAGASLIIAMADPSDISAIDDVKFLTNLNVEVVVASEAAIRRKIDQHFPRTH